MKHIQLALALAANMAIAECRECKSQDREIFREHLQGEMAAASALRLSTTQAKDELLAIAKASDLDSVPLEKLYGINEAFAITNEERALLKQALVECLPKLKILASTECENKQSKALLFAILLNTDLGQEISSKQIWELILKSNEETKLAFTELLTVIRWSANAEFIGGINKLYSDRSINGDKMRKTILESIQGAIEVGLCNEDIALDVFDVLIDNPAIDLLAVKSMLKSIRVSRFQASFLKKVKTPDVEDAVPAPTRKE
jgi:hypothetical protein